MYNTLFPNNPKEAEFYKKYYNTKSENCITYSYYEDIDKDVLDIYVITFNNLFCLEYQIKTLRAFMKQKHNIIIVDNNNDLNPEISKKTLEMCVKENITYLKMPNNFFQTPGNFDPSLKLGTTMNWLFHNCAKKRQAKYFGFLDQDCFLFNECNLSKYLDNKYMYGQLSTSNKFKNAWNLHVTSNFYNYEYVKDLILDFRPSHKWQLDTGGMNYDILYNKMKVSDYELDIRGFRYFDYDIGDSSTFQYYTMHDHKWIHMCGSTSGNLQGQVDTKNAYMKGFLDCILKRNDKSFYFYLDDKCPPNDGPVTEYNNISKSWYLQGKLHRKDGPAIEYHDGSTAWYFEGILHRDNGPAIEWIDGRKEWYSHGKQYIP